MFAHVADLCSSFVCPCPIFSSPSIHPSSVNFRMKPADWGTNHLAFFTIMHSKKLYAWETGPVDDRALVLLCGEADFKVCLSS
jgi:ATP-dependent RNA helicase DHX29